MAGVTLIISVFMIACASGQMPIQSFFSVPGTAFNRGGRVDFTAGLSLGEICKQIMMMGGKEALSDGMGMAAKYLSQQKIGSHIAGGSDPQMACLYSQATGGMMPGTIGSRDPGNMFGDYYDTVIEYPMILDPCTAPQCNGKVNPTALLMQMYAPMMRGMGGGMGGAMGAGMGGAPGNPFSAMGQNPFLSALMPKQNAGPVAPVPAANATNSSGTANPAVPKVASPTLPAQGNPMANLLQNPQMMQMMQQFMNMFMNNPGQAGASPNLGGAGLPGLNPFGNMNGFPMAGSMFV